MYNSLACTERSLIALRSMVEFDRALNYASRLVGSQKRDDLRVKKQAYLPKVNRRENYGAKIERKKKVSDNDT